MPSRSLAFGHYCAGCAVGVYLGAGGHPTFRVAALVVALGATWGARRSVRRVATPARAAADGPLATALAPVSGTGRDEDLLLVS